MVHKSLLDFKINYVGIHMFWSLAAWEAVKSVCKFKIESLKTYNLK